MVSCTVLYTSTVHTVHVLVSVLSSINDREHSRKINSVGPIHDYTCITKVHSTFGFQIFIFIAFLLFVIFIWIFFLTFFPKYNNPKPFHDTLLTMLMVTTLLHHRVKYGNDEQFFFTYADVNYATVVHLFFDRD
jgi:hypothetical protein